MLSLIKHRLIKVLKNTLNPSFCLYNLFQILFPHDKDYYALNLLFKKMKTNF